MASPFGHAVVGTAVYAVLAPRGASLRDWRPWLTAALAGAAADLDFLPGVLVGDPSRYHHWATHSLAAALAFALLVAPVAPAALGAPGRRVAVLGLAYGSHLLLDFFTVDRMPPRGIPLFWPVSPAVFLAPVALFRELQHGPSWAAFLNWHNLQAVLIETVVLGGPAAAVCALRLARESRSRAV